MRGAPQAASGSDVSRTTVDLTAFPDPVVIYLGMCVRTPRGLGTLRSLGKQFERAAAARPDGLLARAARVRARSAGVRRVLLRPAASPSRRCGGTPANGPRWPGAENTAGL